MITETLKKYIREALASVGIDAADSANFVLEHPDELSHGDYSTNAALVFAKKLGIKPRDLAEKIVAKINEMKTKGVAGKIGQASQSSEKTDFIEKIDIAGAGFINFHLSRDFFTKNVEEIIAQKDRFGSRAAPALALATTAVAGKTVLVEYSSPNIAKPFTVGHLRSTVIGDAISNILAFSGYKVVRDNHLGDWGTQFGKQIVAIKKWGSVEELDKIVGNKAKMKYLVDLYVKFHSEAESVNALEDEARAAFAALEKGDADTADLYSKIVAISLEYFKDIYKRLQVTDFDTMHGEHFYESLITGVMEDLKKAKLLQESEGAKLVFFAGEKYPPLMIEKKDGATLYATRDLATDKFRRKEYGPDITVINEVGSEQSLYFKQLFEVEEVLGYFKKSQRVHIAHGFIRFKDGKMSTRKGNVIWLEDIIDEAYTRASKFNPDPKVAEAVAIGAIKFNDLKRESSQDIIFDWDEMLNLTGDSCPYLQYSHARAASVLAKAKEEGIDVSAITQKTGDSGIGDASVLEKIIYRFPEIVERSATDYQPHHIATYLLELAAVFSSFYAIAQIVDKKDPTSPYRVALTQAFEIVMKNGLTLLGIASPEKM